jgi:hypothetical protein
MIIGEIGNNFFHTKKVNFNSNETLLDYDALFIDLNFIVENITHEHGNYHFYEKRKKDLIEFLHFKQIPILYFIPDPILKDTYLWNDREKIIVDYDFFAPIPNINIQTETGKKIEPVPHTLLYDFVTKYREKFHYKSYFTNNYGTSIAETPHLKKVLAFYTNESIFLPRVHNIESKIQLQEFLDELVEFAKQVNRTSQPNPLPEWASNFYLPKEKVLNSEIRDAEEQITAINQKLERLQMESQSYQLKKRLFTASGNDLENEVEAIFKELGVEILEADRNRDDLIIKFKELVAVVEIKGVNNSAAEKHAAQLEKWTANYFEKTGISPKGILIVNTFRETELPGRTQPSFPDQMLKYSTQREHCLITSMQLLGLYYEALANPGKKEELVASLFNTVGIYAGFQDWKTYIESN